CDLVLIPTAGCGSADWGFLQASLDDPQVRRQYIDKCHQVCFPQGAVEHALDLRMAVAACNQAGYDEDTGYFQPGHSSIIDSNGALAALIPGQPCYEHLRPHLADGVVHITHPHHPARNPAA